MWTKENRKRYDRSQLRYPSDLTDEEWSLVAPLIPPAKRGGNRRHVDMREVVNGIMYVLSTGCQWRAVPKDLPPRSTLFSYLNLWSWDGTLDRLHHALYEKCREQDEREASPTACIIDSQSVKSAEKGGPASIRMATMRARRSRARSATSWSTRSACCCTRSFTPPTFRTAMAACCCCPRCSACILSCEAVRRWRLSGADLPKRAGEDPALSQNRDRQALRSGKRVRRAAQALDRRAYPRLAQPLSKARQGLGMPQPQSARLPAPCLHPPHAAKTMQSHMMFPDRL